MHISMLLAIIYNKFASYIIYIYSLYIYIYIIVYIIVCLIFDHPSTNLGTSTCFKMDCSRWTASMTSVRQSWLKERSPASPQSPWVTVFFLAFKSEIIDPTDANAQNTLLEVCAEGERPHETSYLYAMTWVDLHVSKKVMVVQVHVTSQAKTLKSSSNRCSSVCAQEMKIRFAPQIGQDCCIYTWWYGAGFYVIWNFEVYICMHFNMRKAVFKPAQAGEEIWEERWSRGGGARGEKGKEDQKGEEREAASWAGRRWRTQAKKIPEKQRSVTWRAGKIARPFLSIYNMNAKWETCETQHGIEPAKYQGDYADQLWFGI